MRKPESGKDWSEILKTLRIVGVIGWVMALALVIGIGGGLWLDSKFACSPVFLIIGIIWGLGGGIWYTYRQLVRLLDENNQDQSKRM